MIKKDKTGRNDPCPCGSGKKYKRCCLLKDNKKRSEHKETFKPEARELLDIKMVHDFLFENKKSLRDELFETGKINKLSFDYFKTDEFADLYFSEMEINRCMNRMGEFKNDPEDPEKAIQYLRGALRILTTQGREKEIIWYLYRKLPELNQRKEYKKAWAILAAVESIIDYQEKEHDLINPCLYHMFTRGIERMQTTGRMFEGFLDTVALSTNTTCQIPSDSKKVSERDYIDYIETLETIRDNKEIEKKLKEFLDKNPKFKQATEEFFNEAYIDIGTLSEDKEMCFIYFPREELMPELMELERFSIEKGQEEMTENEMKDKIVECINNALKRVTTDERIGRINSFLRNLRAEAKSRGDYYKFARLNMSLEIMKNEPYENPFLFGLVFQSLKCMIDQMLREG